MRSLKYSALRSDEICRVVQEKRGKREKLRSRDRSRPSCSSCLDMGRHRMTTRTVSEFFEDAMALRTARPWNPFALAEVRGSRSRKHGAHLKITHEVEEETYIRRVEYNE